MDQISTSSSSRKFVVRDDRIPDEILVSILSKLSCIEEAAMTSILSRRWEKLWFRFEGNLEFDVSKLHNVRVSDWPQIRYLHSINQILPTLIASSFKSLRLRFRYRRTQLRDFDTILDFLMSKRIRILEFDMYPKHAIIMEPFCFSNEFYARIKEPPGLHNISALTSLSLQNVNVSDDMIEYFVSNCPLLERLCVQYSDLLSNHRIIGDASLKLKYLKIRGLNVMKSLVVSAPNLVSLAYEGVLHEIKIDVSNVPKLGELCIGRHIMAYMSGSLSTYLAQIHTLNLSFSNFTLFTSPNNVVFRNLKHLVFRVSIQYDDESLLGFTSSLVEASPLLEKFTMEPVTYVTEDLIGLHKMITPTTKQYSNQRLKVVELIYFTGVTPEVELLLYFVQNFSCSLERIIIDTRSINIVDTPCQVLRPQAKKERALQLMKHIPVGVDFLLI